MHCNPCLVEALGTDDIADAEECWVQLTNALKEVQGLPGPSSGSSSGAKFVEQYMTGELRRVYALPFQRVRYVSNLAVVD